MAALASPVLPSSACRCGYESLDSGISMRRSGLQIGSARFGEADGAPFWRAHGANWARAPERGRRWRAEVGTAAVESTAVDDTSAGDSVQNVVIVGAGIAGLSAAVALHSVGVKALVLEQSTSVRASGASLTLWGNAWRALDYLGVADDLRKEYTLMRTMQICSRSGKRLKGFDLKTAPGGPHEVRGVVRRLLVESLAAKLPAGTVRVNSQVCAVDWDPHKGRAKVTLEDGSEISTKVLVGCDGVNSVVRKWLGLAEPRYVGQMGIRGVAEYPDGHELGDTTTQYLGDEGSRCGVFPISRSKVYWFVCYCDRNPGPKLTDPKLIRAQALEIVKEGWPKILPELLNKSPDDTISRAALSDRWNIPGLTPPVVKEGVTLGGDALHPMSPNLGQGGCTAIEDGIILARKLVEIFSEQKSDDPDSIHRALQAYAAERQKRAFPITVKSFIAGTLLALSFPPVVFVRNNFALPNVTSERFLEHTMYDVGRLPATSRVTLE